MVRFFRALPAALLPAALVFVAGAQSALADASWPNEDTDHLVRGPGGYLSVPKLLFCWLLFSLWVRTVDWINHDVQRNRLSYAVWNSAAFFSFVAAFVLLWVLPWFWLAAFLMVAAYAGPLAGYVVVRNRSVSSERRVFTRDHLRHVLAEKGKLLGLKISAEKQDPRSLGPAVTFAPKGGKTDRDNAANLLLARQSPGFPAARRLIADALEHRADAVLLDYTAQGVTSRLQIDGVWHNHEPYERADGDPMLAVFKTISALNVNERRAKQEGAFDAEFNKAKRKCRIVSQGTQTGERILLQLPEAATKKWTFEELGMRAKVEEQFRALRDQPQGIILFSAPPGGGLSTILDTGIRALDRFLRDVVVVEDAVRRVHEIENAAVTTFNSAAGETPMSVLPKLARAYPNIYVLRELPDADTINFLCAQTKESRLSLGGLRAKECAEALLRVLVMKVPARTFAPTVIGVVNQRLIRKLCEKCKESYAPTPELLKQLGLPAGRVTELFRPPTPQPDEKKPPPPCGECQGIGYLGRTGIFELLVVNDTVREALVKSPKLEIVRAAARKAGMRLHQEEGIALVARGVTSVAELMRVLKG
ncbi:MAG TPA: ATPase, T2SS/T4P/T4SS family [Pirellulales bacterium]|nr:ATPase, T2SS/T4P/T4SS family [Pirellulales bacterium]